MRRWARRLGWSLVLIVTVFLVAAIATARSGDPDLYPPPARAPRIDVFVVSHGYHAGIVVPRARLAEVAAQNGLHALDAVAARFDAYRWLEIGWGDEGFYTSVPTIASLTIRSAARALFLPGNPSVLHVVGLVDHPRTAFASADVARLALSEAGFARLLARIDASFAPGQQDLGPGLYGPSRFYRALGTFHVFNVCNHWISDLLDAAGVPTAPVLATLPPGLLLDLRWRAGAVLLPDPR
jgi:uncharacterized protein (TIGR02117 family)